MPRAIAIDTAGREGSIVAVRDGLIGPEQLFPHGLRHAAGIVLLVDRVCREQGWKPTDVEHLYLSIGPGSFTGLRIAVTLAKTMALTSGVKIVAVPTPRVLAENAPPEARHVVTVADAKRGQIFTARYSRDGHNSWQGQEPPHLDRLADAVARSPRPVYLIGEGIPYHEDAIPRGPDVIVTPAALWRSRATVVAELGIAMATAGDFADPDRLTPLYIRKAEAEEKWEAEQKSR